VNTLEDDAIVLETQGNVHLMDNVIISRPGAKGPAVRAGVSLAGAPKWEGIAANFHDGWAAMGLSAIGNTFTVDNPLLVKGQLFELDTHVTKREAQMKLIKAPLLPGVLPRHDRQVFEVPAGADATVIQQAIDAACKLASARPDAWPVVHLPQGRYPLQQTLLIPAGARINLLGDGCYTMGTPQGTLLTWTDEQAAGPVLRIKGPAQARLRDFGIITTTPWQRADAKLRTPGTGGLEHIPAPSLQDAIQVAGIDQPGGKVTLQECNPNGLFGAGTLIEGLDHTFVQILACEGTGLEGGWNRKWDGQEKLDPWAPYPAVRVVGGAAAQAGHSVPGVLIQGGDTGRWDVQRGGKLVVRDCWYENNWLPFHMLLHGNGRFTLDCAYDAQFTHPTLKGVGVSYAFTDWHGRFVSLNVGVDNTGGNPEISCAGDCAGGQLLFLGNSGIPAPLAGAGAWLGDLNRRLGTEFLANPPNLPANRLRELLSDDREMRYQPLKPEPPGITDLRLSRIWTWNSRVGLHLQGQ